MTAQGLDFLAVDLGASNGRLINGTWDGRQFHLHEVHRFPNGPVHVLGHLHWDVLHMWQEIQHGLQRYTSTSSNPLVSVGVDTWGVDFALLDRSGHLIGNPYHYRDARTDGMMERAFARVPQEEIFARTGIQFMQLNTLYQLLSMVEGQHPALDVAHTLLMMPDLFHYWLTGVAQTEYTIASTTQLLNAHRREWDKELMEALGIPAHLFLPLVNPGSVVGTVREEVRNMCALPPDVQVITPGSHDTASAVAAVSELDERSAYISVGTWSLMGVEIPEPIITEDALRLHFTNEGGVGGSIRFLHNMTGLWLLQECRRQWQREGRMYSWEDMLALAEQARPFRCLIDPDALDFLHPDNMPEAIRTYCARTGQPIPEDDGAVIRCSLESLALKHRWVLDALERLVEHPLDTVRIVGGGSRNRLLCQYTANACARPVVAGPVEATALGNIMVQAVATGHLDSIAAGRAAIAASVPRDTYEPRDTEMWEEAYQRFLNVPN